MPIMHALNLEIQDEGLIECNLFSCSFEQNNILLNDFNTRMCPFKLLSSHCEMINENGNSGKELRGN
jgi:hypothetical protein